MRNCTFLFKQMNEKKTCHERPNLACDRFIKVLYKTLTCLRRPLLSGPKSGCLIQVSRYQLPFTGKVSK